MFSSTAALFLSIKTGSTGFYIAHARISINSPGVKSYNSHKRSLASTFITAEWPGDSLMDVKIIGPLPDEMEWSHISWFTLTSSSMISTPESRSLNAIVMTP